MLPYGYEVVRQNVLCPKCLTLERHRIMWLFLKNKTGFFTDSLKVLHIAPEQCFHSKFKKLKNLDYTTADMFSPLADVKLDVQDMPFGENTYDMVICNHVLEHVEDDKKAMQEIKRVLKPGGFAIMQVPLDFNKATTFEDPTVTDPEERKRLFLQYDHLRLYGRDYPEQVKRQGFEIKDDDYLQAFNDNEKEYYCLPGNDYMYAFYKPAT